MQVTYQRYNLFNIFLTLPAGFLRALASKQVRCAVCGVVAVVLRSGGVCDLECLAFTF